MKLLWIFRAIFLVIIVASVFVNISSPIMDKDDEGITSKETYEANLRAIIFSSIGMAVFVLLLDVLTPKKKFSALAGVFFGLLVGILVSWLLAPVVDMVSGTFSVDVTEAAITAIKWAGLRCRIDVEASGPGLKAELRTKPADPASSIGGSKLIGEDGKVGLLVEDEELAGCAAFVVIIDAAGGVIVREHVIVGGEEK